MVGFDRTYAEINLENIMYNVNELKKCINSSVRVMFIIKADGYGHGAVPIMKYLADNVDAYGVATIDEAVELRKNGCDKLILILGYTPKSCLKYVVDYDISQSVFDIETAKILSQEALRANKKAKVHIKLDTGMGRIGFVPGDESLRIIKDIARLPGITLEGCFSHFSKADEKNLEYTQLQFDRFMTFTEQLKDAGVELGIRHICNSAAVMQFNKASLDMVRFGIASYGLYPSDEISHDEIVLKPAMSWKSIISHIKTVPAGTRIGYNGTYITKDVRTIATIPVGYADGYPRALSGCGRVFIHGRSAPIVGRVCMDQFMVDITEIIKEEDVKVEDEVILLGKAGNDSITANELSAPGNSFNYEFVCDVGNRVPRIYE